MGLFIFLFRYKYYLIYNNTKQANFMFLPHDSFLIIKTNTWKANEQLLWIVVWHKHVYAT